MVNSAKIIFREAIKQQSIVIPLKLNKRAIDSFRCTDACEHCFTVLTSIYASVETHYIII